MTTRAKSTPDEIAIRFAEHMPIGTRCRYYPILPCDEDEFIMSAIRSAPWVLGHGAVVVAIEGRSGGMNIKHIFPAADGEQR